MKIAAYIGVFASVVCVYVCVCFDFVANIEKVVSVSATLLALILDVFFFHLQYKNDGNDFN